MRYTEAPFLFVGPLAWDCILSFGQLLRQRQSLTALHTRFFFWSPRVGLHSQFRAAAAGSVRPLTCHYSCAVPVNVQTHHCLSRFALATRMPRSQPTGCRNDLHSRLMLVRRPPHSCYFRMNRGMTVEILKEFQLWGLAGPPGKPTGPFYCVRWG